MSTVKQFIRALLDVLLPPVCHICHSFIPDAGKLHICQSCHKCLSLVSSPFCPTCGIPFTGSGNNHRCGACLTHPPHFDTAKARYLYEGQIRELIHSFKYNHNIRIWSPPYLQGLIHLMTGTGLLPYIRPLSEE
jgi:predicted amidophosphoribosyltransferase